MIQWEACKAKAPEALLLFRLGDFYEAFHEDAKLISKEIGLTLTGRQGTPMCGVPFHTADSYIDKLVAKGYKIAIAEQMEDPRSVKGLVKREIVRIVTPGTLVNSGLLSDKRNNYFACIAGNELATLDVSTGEFRIVKTSNDLADELHRIRPSEILTNCELPELRFPCVVNKREFKEAVPALLSYLKELNLRLDHVAEPVVDSLQSYMALDRSTLANLEIDTLLELIDQTATPMGARLLATWIKHPLLQVSEIEKRQDAVEAFLKTPILLQDVRDLERLMMKTSANYGTPRDLLALGLSMSKIPAIQEALANFTAPEIVQCQSALSDPVSIKILSVLSDSPPLRIGEGDVFKDGVHPELDRLRTLSRDSITWMANYQVRLREETNIKTLKVGYTKAFGYYIEVSRAQGDRIPAGFQRRQTLVNAERFITEELKNYEYQVLTAEERSKALEIQLFEQLRSEVARHSAAINRTAKAIGRIDALLSLAHVAKEHKWNRPLVDDSDLFEIKEGRHPLVEKSVGRASFIPNDTSLSHQLMLITGPNMAGKSTYIRQTALIAILAQIGSFVPATSARIGLVDKIFSRIGASDDLARGQSTFMVEMTETANILHHATAKSLVLLDEIGRGTSTYDGISIAWSVAEYLMREIRAKTLFATHYWELTQLPGALNFQVAVQETADGVVFLRKIIRGGTDKSYGIHVAKLAGLPTKVIRRAQEMLKELESKPKKKPDEQLTFIESPVVAELKKLNVDRMTPIDALLCLQRLTNTF